MAKITFFLQILTSGGIFSILVSFSFIPLFTKQNPAQSPFLVSMPYLLAYHPHVFPKLGGISYMESWVSSPE